ncbi:MAG: hypothetical protein ACOCV2_09355 [Persicimonas sp.]
MMRKEITQSIREVGAAVRRPEQLAERFRDGGPEAPSPMVIIVLLTNAILGTAAYGLTMQMHRGVEGMLEGAFLAPTAAGLGWAIALPSLYIVKRLLGSNLDAVTTLLAASIAVSFGASAMLASVPINWFFTLSLPFAEARTVVNLVVFIGVGLCMVDIFIRVLRRLEPDSGHLFGYVWLTLLATLGAEFFVLFGVFDFG